MFQKNINQPGPLYRKVLSHALAIAWREKRLWGFAVLAGLLQTGGILDALVRSLQNISDQTPSVFNTNWLIPLPSTTLGAFALTTQALAALLMLAVVFVASVTAQGALAMGLSKQPRLGLLELIFAAGRVFWPLAGLNALVLLLLWCARFLLLIPLAFSLAAPTFLSVAIYLLAFALFLIASLLFTAIHLFALQAIAVKKKTLLNALALGYEHFKRAWLVVAEIAFLMVFAGLAIFGLAAVVFFVGIIPLFLLLFIAATLQWQMLLSVGVWIGILYLVAIVFAAGSFAITFQYAAWGALYDRINEKNATAKLHRLLHWLIG